MSDGPIARAGWLLGQGRSEDALEYLSTALADDPDDPQAHCLRALALLDLGEFTDALDSAHRASGEAPDWAYTHYVTANVLLVMGKPKRALEPALEAVALDPEDKDHFAMLSSCYVGLSRWRDALGAAEKGLRLAPKDTRCANLRALCLRQLGETDEAAEALTTSLAEDPENAWTHQNLGWTAIKDGRYDDAIASFRESLRLDPDDDEARVGLATAIKGKVPLFRPLIAWQMLCSRLSTKLGFGLVIGLVLLNRIVQSQLGPDSTLGTVLLVTYVSFVWMSWAGSALFDVLLLLRKEWRPILTTREKTASAGVILCVLLATMTISLRFTLHLGRFQWTAFAFAFAAIPTSAWANMPNAKARGVGALVAAGAFFMALGALALQLYVLSLLDWDLNREFLASELEEVIARTRPNLERGDQLTLISIVISVGASWIMPLLGFIPEGRGGRGQRRRPNGI